MWPRGWRYSPAKGACGLYPHRGFESLHLRQIRKAPVLKSTGAFLLKNENQRTFLVTFCIQCWLLFDAVALVVSKEQAPRLVQQKAVQDFVSDAYAHLKAIACTSAAELFLEKLHIEQDDFVLSLDKPKQVVDLLASRCWQREQGSSCSWNKQRVF